MCKSIKIKKNYFFKTITAILILVGMFLNNILIYGQEPNVSLMANTVSEGINYLKNGSF